MNRVIILFIGLFLFSTMLSGQSESDYARWIQSEIGGELEVEQSDGSRVDLMTDVHAYEIERAYNWKESIGQSLWYAMQLNRQPGIILIRETKADFKYVQQLISTIHYMGMTKDIKVLIFPDDFKDASEYILQRESQKTAYWLSRNSKKRHNDRCHNYENTNGYYCGPFDGKAAGCCGG